MRYRFYIHHESLGKFKGSLEEPRSHNLQKAEGVIPPSTPIICKTWVIHRGTIRVDYYLVSHIGVRDQEFYGRRDILRFSETSYGNPVLYGPN